jgi:hypothetical protein
MAGAYWRLNLKFRQHFFWELFPSSRLLPWFFIAPAAEKLSPEVFCFPKKNREQIIRVSLSLARI